MTKRRIEETQGPICKIGSLTISHARTWLCRPGVCDATLHSHLNPFQLDHACASLITRSTHGWFSNEKFCFLFLFWRALVCDLLNPLYPRGIKNIDDLDFIVEERLARGKHQILQQELQVQSSGIEDWNARI